MSLALRVVEETVVPLQKKRSWSREQKEEMLREAAETSFPAAARKFGVAPSQLFSWRKEFRVQVQPPKVKQDCENLILESCTSSLRLMNKTEKLFELALDKAFNDLCSGAMKPDATAKLVSTASRNASTSLSNKIALIERIQALLPKEERTDEDLEIEREISRTANKILRDIAIQQLAERRQKNSVWHSGADDLSQNQTM